MKKTYELIAENEFCEEKNLRYRLYRHWDAKKPTACVIMFNPARIDPNPFRLGVTLTKVFEHIENDYGSMVVVNLYPTVKDKKKDLKQNERKFDERNFTYIKNAVMSSDKVVLFWGNDTGMSKDVRFIRLLRENENKLNCFRLTEKSKQPDYIYALNRNNHTLKKCIITAEDKFQIID
ncbi:hypothetical protein BRE01_62970 [Brevibacillus reuszeri]|uniref:DUF1643 domain-containing protein n=1 Tax=Brevibacillus reuszeri TaxID=54915 RepID=A0ABQ0TXN7_9BACL|nr:DUF1643 domain-containing protein [Brevibacillus reuszeri]GED72595.1 hypothetical protein BRE01_62970 [Brevibacillus reuszeri]